MPYTPSGEASLFSMFGFIEPKPQRQKKEPLFRGAWRRRACLEIVPDRREGFKLEFQDLKSV
jgi:hypothetical protein